MAQLLLDLLATALSAAVGQQMIIRMVHLLATAKKPIQNGFWFLLGAVVYCLLISVVVLVLSSLTEGRGTQPKPTWHLLLALVLSMLFVFLAVRTAWAKPNSERVMKSYKRIAALASESPLQVSVAGFVVQVTLIRSLIFLIVALNQITDAQLGIVLSSVALVVYLLLAFALYEVPLLLYMAAPQQAAILVDRVSHWLQDHNKAVMVLIDLFMAYLLLKAGLGGLLNR
jgi:hypothetical protein